MKYLLILLICVGLAGCGPTTGELISTNKELVVERSYICLEFGYLAAKEGKSLEEAQAILESIIGPREVEVPDIVWDFEPEAVNKRDV